MEDKTLLIVLEGIQNSQVKIVEIRGQMHERMEANDLALAKMIADNNQTLAKILQHVVDVTTRTERMTSEILTRLASSQGQSH
jgi:hypothetical protein